MKTARERVEQENLLVLRNNALKRRIKTRLYNCRIASVLLTGQSNHFFLLPDRVVDHFGRVRQFADLLKSAGPMLALAPMQDVTDLAFWRVIMRYGGPDVYWTEYFRVHAESRLERWILESITKNPTSRPVIAQLIGNDVPALVRSARELQQYPVAAIDLNLGCPAPVVYRKCAGGGLLRDLARVDSILGALRDNVTVHFTVKTRVGFDADEFFGKLLDLFRKHSIDLLTVHGRTVIQMYQPGVRYDLIRRAAQEMPFPVLGNGDIRSAQQALELNAWMGTQGLMIGRAAIRNPWLFNQIRQAQLGEAVEQPSGRDLFNYIRELWESQVSADVSELSQVQRMKKFMNFIGEGIGPEFLHGIRRVTNKAGFFALCHAHLDHDETMELVPVAPDSSRTGVSCS